VTEQERLEQRLLIQAPTGRDGALAVAALEQAGLHGEAFADITSLCEATSRGAGALLLAEEALTSRAQRCLSEVLARQPAWSDLPIVIFAAAVDSKAATARMQQMTQILGNVTFVDRPVRIATLVTVMSAALRARNRQYAARGLLLALEKQKEEARKRADFEQQLIGIVSHDLRNPLYAIQMTAAALGRREELDERVARSVLRINTAAERATRMIRDLLDFTEARLGGGLRIRPQPTDLHALTRHVLEEVEAAYPGRQVKLLQAGDGHGEWDADRLAQVLQNLVTNALKYSPEGTVVKVETHGLDGQVELVVHNEGEPIPREKVAQLFEPMQRASQEVDRASRSVGLGLYIVKQIVDAHGGAVDADLSEGAGMTFTVRLPRLPGRN
jgi:signal transduction histidine kinase